MRELPFNTACSAQLSPLLIILPNQKVENNECA